MPPSPSRKKAERKKAERHGHFGELWAALYLQAQFYRIRTRRLKTPVGEIDLVVQRGGELVFVEVKTRRDQTQLGMALEAVNQQRILRAAAYYLSRNPKLAQLPMRFDVIFLTPFGWPHHLKNAFDAS